MVVTDQILIPSYYSFEALITSLKPLSLLSSLYSLSSTPIPIQLTKNPVRNPPPLQRRPRKPQIHLGQRPHPRRREQRLRHPPRHLRPAELHGHVHLPQRFPARPSRVAAQPLRSPFTHFLILPRHHRRKTSPRIPLGSSPRNVYPLLRRSAELSGQEIRYGGIRGCDRDAV